MDSVNIQMYEKILNKLKTLCYKESVETLQIRINSYNEDLSIIKTTEKNIRDIFINSKYAYDEYNDDVDDFFDDNYFDKILEDLNMKIKNIKNNIEITEDELKKSF
jgi:hypothetical protein